MVTAYNYARFLQRAIRSCLHQRYMENEVEIIVVGDASTDETLQVVEPFAEMDNFSFIRNEQNLGVAGAANIGFRAARGQLITRVDADDYVSELFAFMLATYMEFNHEVFGVACDYTIVDEFENPVERRRPDTHPISCGILYRKEWLTSVGLYDDGFRHCEEEELRLRLGSRYVVDRLALPLYRYRMHGKNKTSDPGYLATKSRLTRR